MDLGNEVDRYFIINYRDNKTAINIRNDHRGQDEFCQAETDVAASSSLSPGDDRSQILYNKRLMLIPTRNKTANKISLFLPERVQLSQELWSLGCSGSIGW